MHPSPEWLCHQFITPKIKYETFFSKNGYGVDHTQKSHVVLSKCDNVIENIHILFWFEILHKCENKYEKGIFDHFFFFFKSLNLQKIENHVATFPCWFWFGNNVLGDYISS